MPALSLASTIDWELLGYTATFTPTSGMSHLPEAPYETAFEGHLSIVCPSLQQYEQSGDLTVTSHLIVLLPSSALITAEPGEIALAVPLESVMRTDVSLEVHMMVAL